MITLVQDTEQDRNLRQRELQELRSLGDLTPIAQVAEESSVPATFYDSDGLDVTGSQTYNDYEIVTLPNVNIENLNPSFAQIDNNVLRRAADGIGQLEFSRNGIKTRRVFDCSHRGPGTVFRFTEYTPGTVSAYLSDQIKSLIDSDLTKRDMLYFSTFDHLTSSFVKNPDCWARDVDLSAFAIGSQVLWQGPNSWTTERGGTLITPRHVLIATHYTPNENEKFRFLTAGGLVVEATWVGKSNAYGTVDQRVLTLDVDVAGCNPMKVGNDWLTTRVSQDIYYGGGLAISTNQFRETSLSIVGSPVATYADNFWGGEYPVGVMVTGQKRLHVYNGAYATSRSPYILANSDLTSMRGSHNEGIISGDSGSPVIVVVEGEPVVVTCWHGATVGPSTWIGDGNNEQLNALIAEADADAGVCLGYLREPEATEQLLYNTDLTDTSEWTQDSISQDGSTTFRGYSWPNWKETSSTGIHRDRQNLTGLAASKYFEVYYKPDGRPYLNFYDTAYTGVQIHIDTDALTITTTNGSVVQNLSIIAVEDGWFRIRFSIPSGQSNYRLALSFAENNTTFNTNYAGNTNLGGTFAFPSCQTDGGTWTSFIPTTSATVTRASDYYNTDITGLITAPEGTLLLDVIPLASNTGASGTLATISEAVRSYGDMYMRSFGATTIRTVQYHDTGQTQAWQTQYSHDTTSSGLRVLNKVASAWASGGAASCCNGGTLVTSGAVADPMNAPTKLYLGTSSETPTPDGAACIIARARLADTRLPNGKLQQLTS